MLLQNTVYACLRENSRWTAWVVDNFWILHFLQLSYRIGLKLLKTFEFLIRCLHMFLAFPKLFRTKLLVENTDFGFEFLPVLTSLSPRSINFQRICLASTMLLIWSYSIVSLTLKVSCILFNPYVTSHHVVFIQRPQGLDLSLWNYSTRLLVVIKFESSPGFLCLILSRWFFRVSWHQIWYFLG